jgi:hypothetical protein
MTYKFELEVRPGSAFNKRGVTTSMGLTFLNFVEFEWENIPGKSYLSSIRIINYPVYSTGTHFFRPIYSNQFLVLLLFWL